MLHFFLHSFYFQKQISRFLLKIGLSLVEPIEGQGKILMKCSNCDSIFRNKFLAEHRKSHLDAEGNLPCPQCEKSCPNYTEMAKHMHAIHNVGPIYECMQCDWKNKNKQLYNKHMNTAHVDKSDKKFICDQVIVKYNFLIQFSITEGK